MKSKSHRISIPSILEIKQGTISKLGNILLKKQITEITILIDNFMYKMIGNKIEHNLEENNIHYSVKILEEFDYHDITSLAYSISGDVQAIIGIGGGKVLDIAKYISFLRKKPFISVPTSASNDGFASPVASLIINNKKTTVPAKVPFGVIIDIDIIKTAPEGFIYSGIGDSVSNYTAVWDMEYETKHRNIEIDTFAKMVSVHSIEVLIKNETNNIKDTNFLTRLLETLTMSGISMEISGSSSPASGSEHLISHSIDKLYNEKSFPHGIQVGIGTYIIATLQDNPYKNDIKDFLTKVGFFDYVKTLKIPKVYFERAIKIAPSIKDYRRTIIHDEDKQKEALLLLKNDALLNNILF